MSEIGENIYDTTKDDLNQIGDGIKDARDAYDKGKNLYNHITNAKAKAGAASGADAAAEGAAGGTASSGAAAEGAAGGTASSGAAVGTGATEAGTSALATTSTPVLAIILISIGVFAFLALSYAYMQEMGQSSSGRRYAETVLNQQLTHNDSGTFEEGNNDDKPDDDPDYSELYEFYGGSPYLKGYLQFITFLKGTEKTVEDTEGNEVLEGTIKAMKEEKDFPTTVGAFEKAKKLILLDAQAWVDSYKSMSGLGHDCIHDKSSGSVSEGDHCDHGTIDEYDRFGNKMECDGWTSETSKEVMSQIEAAVETLFDDVDYAELVCVLGENENYDLDSMTEESFRAIFMGKKSRRSTVL